MGASEAVWHKQRIAILVRTLLVRRVETPVFLLIFLPKSLVPVVQIDATALNIGSLDMSRRFEGISVRDNERCIFSHLE